MHEPETSSTSVTAVTVVSREFPESGLMRAALALSFLNLNFPSGRYLRRGRRRRRGHGSVTLAQSAAVEFACSHRALAGARAPRGACGPDASHATRASRQSGQRQLGSPDSGFNFHRALPLVARAPPPGPGPAGRLRAASESEQALRRQCAGNAGRRPRPHCAAPRSRSLKPRRPPGNADRRSVHVRATSSSKLNDTQAQAAVRVCPGLDSDSEL